MKAYLIHARRFLACIVIFCAITAVIAAETEEERVKLKQVVGTIEVRAPGAPWRAARIGMTLKTGWDIRTFVESTAEIEYASGTIIRIGENSVVTLAALITNSKDKSSVTSVKVPSGQVWANIKKLTSTQSKFDFETPTAVASIRGTRLGILVRDRRTEIDVYEGDVRVRNKETGAEAKATSKMRAVVAPGSSGVDVVDFSKVKKDTAAKKDAIVDPFTGDSTKTEDTTKAKPDTLKPKTDTLKPKTDTLKKGAVDKPEDKPFSLNILSPQGAAAVSQTPVLVRGTAAPGAGVTIGPKEIPVGADGSFSDFVDLQPGPNSISVVAYRGSIVRNTIITVTYRPPLFLSVNNIIDNMEVMSPELPLEIEVTEGALFSVNGSKGATKINLNPGKNQILVKAWDTWGGQTDRTFLVNYKQAAGFALNVAAPADNSTVAAPVIPVAGSTSPGAKVTVNGTPVTVNASGFFSSQIPIPAEPRDYSLEIVSRLDGEEKSVVRTVTFAPPVRPLELVVSSPGAGQLIRQSSIHVAGKTSEGAVVRINGLPAVVSSKGVISSDVQVGEKDIGSFTLEIVASRDDQELTKTVSVKLDITSPQINTSRPRLQVTGLGSQATRTGQLSLQVFDQTPGDQIAVTVINNGTSEKITLDPGGRENIALNEGKNNLVIKARDLAGNEVAAVNGQIYYLPGPLEINVVEPDGDISIDDLPPWPGDTGNIQTKIHFKVEIRDGIGTVPEAIKNNCRITSSAGVTKPMKPEGNYFYSVDMPLRPPPGSRKFGSAEYTIFAEDLAGNVQMKKVYVRIRE